MDIFSDVVLLSRIQFALTVIYHFLFVPITIGLGLILAISETKYYRSRKPEDAAAAKFWVKLFTVTFAIGVATGITMEFSFGTNWADYARYVGNIFGAPLAAEALLAFFLESVFLGILLFGRNRIKPKFYLASAWLVWIGSCLSALWIIIANSWQQTPAGATVSADGTQAILTDFFAAIANPTTWPRYAHTVDALLIMGAFVAMAVAAYYLLKGRHTGFAMKAMKIGATVGIITSCLMIVFAHSSAVVVSQEQPTKLAMMEGMYDSEVPPLYAFGWVDENDQSVIAPIAIPGGTSFLATGTWDTEFPGLNQLAQTEQYQDLNPEDLPVGAVFQSYHLMVIMYGLIMLTVILALVFTIRGGGRIKQMKWLQRLVMVSPLFPIIAIITGWLTAELGRQPWAVYPSTSGPDGVALLTQDATSHLTAPELIVTIVLFTVIYLVLFIGYVRIVAHIIKKGPDEASAEGIAPAAAVGTAGASDAAAGSGVASAATPAADAPASAKDGE